MFSKEQASHAKVKRSFDVIVAGISLVVLSPVMALAAFAVWLGDRRSPFYVAPRFRDRDATFRMYKLRTMVHGADRLGGTSTSQTDGRVTSIGRLLRRFKLDELPQLLNVVLGDMSLVGPRPQVREGVERYSQAECALLDVRPGLTDFASIVFADEGAILAGEANPDEAYDRLIRPGKSRLGLFYVFNHTVVMDLLLLALTAVALLSRALALRGVQRLLAHYGADSQLVRLAGRADPLCPPGAPDSRVLSPSGQTR